MAFTRYTLSDNQSLAWATVSASSGDLIIMVFVNDGGDNHTTPSGWTRLDSNNGLSVELGTYYLVATGSETGNVVTDETDFDITDEQYCCHVIKIPAAEWHGTTAPVALEARGDALPSPGTLIDPPSISPAWGAETGNIWIVAGGRDDDDGITDASANYSANFTRTASNTGAGTCEIGTSWRTTNGATEDPGVWDHPLGSEEWLAVTIAVRPAAAGVTVNAGTDSLTLTAQNQTVTQTIETEQGATDSGNPREHAYYAHWEALRLAVYAYYGIDKH